MAVSPSILSPQLRAKLFNPPADHDEVQRRYALAPDDLALCKRHRRQHNRLGFAVQLALVRNPVYFTDDAGCLCVMMPDGNERRLTDVEIEVLTR